MSGSTACLAQQANYRKSGFRSAWNNVRHEGAPAAAPVPAGVSLLDARSVAFDKLAAYDRRFFPEARDSFLASWITLPERAAMVALRDGELAGFAVMRACQAASRIGPLFAQSPEIAASLISSLAAKTGATAVAIDMPDINKPAIALAERIGLKPSFETARMYTGPDPKVDYAGLFGVTSSRAGLSDGRSAPAPGTSASHSDITVERDAPSPAAGQRLVQDQHAAHHGHDRDGDGRQRRDLGGRSFTRANQAAVPSAMGTAPV